jgi:Protein of unknown function (DUF3306)
VSESEPFLSRWSRLKQETAKRATGPAPDAASPTTGEAREGDETGAPATTPGIEAEAAETFDPASLPPLESIEAGTDIRAFLARGVPAELTQAALRRAWAADPAIRDFIGLSENSWDFTAPDGVPGFGPMRPTDDIQELLAYASGRTPKVDVVEGSGAEPGAPQSPISQAADSPRETAAPPGGDEVTHGEAHESVKIAEDQKRTADIPVGMQSANIDNNNEDVAVQNTNNSRELSAMIRPRGRGGALPK